MLPGLELVPWTSLYDASGSARAVPHMLKQLESRDTTARELAIEQLWTALCDQGTMLSEATSHAVPFLVELACDRAMLDRPRILELLQCIAEAATRTDISDGDEHERTFVRLVRRKDAHPSQAEVRESARQALASMCSRLCTLLADPDAEVRARAALVLARVARPEQAERSDILPLLARALAEEPDADTRVAFVAALEVLGAHDLLRTALSDASDEVRMRAALALLAVDAPGSEAYGIVGTVLRKLDEQTMTFAERAWAYSPVHVMQAVCQAGRRAADHFLPALLRALMKSPVQRTELDLVPLLQLYFPSGLAAELSREQCAVIAALCECDDYFEGDDRALRALSAHGLPVRSGALRALVKSASEGAVDLGLRRVTAQAAQAQRRKLRAHPCPTAVRTLSVRRLEEQGFSELRRFPRLNHLTLSAIRLTRPALRELAGLRALVSLALDDASVDAASEPELGYLTTLEDLTLIDTALEGGYRMLAQLRGLRRLSLIGATLSAQDLALASLDLTQLSLEACALTTEEPLSLGALSRLEVLRVAALSRGFSLGDLGGLTKLRALSIGYMPCPVLFEAPPELVDLELVASEVSPERLLHLLHVPSLRRVLLVHMKLTQALVDALASAKQLAQIDLVGTPLTGVNWSRIRPLLSPRSLPSSPKLAHG